MNYDNNGVVVLTTYQLNNAQLFCWRWGLGSKEWTGLSWQSKGPYSYPW